MVPCKDRRASVCPSCSRLYQGRLAPRGRRHPGRQGRRRRRGRAPPALRHLDRSVLRARPRPGDVGGLGEAVSTAASRELPARALPRLCAAPRGGSALLGEPLCVECFDYRGRCCGTPMCPRLWVRTSLLLYRAVAAAGKLLGERDPGDAPALLRQGGRVPAPRSGAPPRGAPRRRARRPRRCAARLARRRGARRRASARPRPAPTWPCRATAGTTLGGPAGAPRSTSASSGRRQPDDGAPSPPTWPNTPPRPPTRRGPWPIGSARRPSSSASGCRPTSTPWCARPGRSVAPRSCGTSRLREHAHALGYGGQFSSKSRRLLDHLRRAARGPGRLRPGDGEDDIDFDGEWRFGGRGYAHPDAAGLAERAARGRPVSPNLSRTSVPGSSQGHDLGEQARKNSRWDRSRDASGDRSCDGALARWRHDHTRPTTHHDGAGPADVELGLFESQESRTPLSVHSHAAEVRRPPPPGAERRGGRARGLWPSSNPSSASLARRLVPPRHRTRARPGRGALGGLGGGGRAPFGPAAPDQGLPDDGDLDRAAARVRGATATGGSSWSLSPTSSTSPFRMSRPARSTLEGPWPGLLDAAVAAGVINANQALVVAQTRIEGRGLAEVARQLGRPYDAVQKERRRAEHALRTFARFYDSRVPVIGHRVLQRARGPRRRGWPRRRPSTARGRPRSERPQMAQAPSSQST